MNGVLLGYPMLNAKVKILEGKYSVKRTNPLAIEIACSEMI
jgi:hypothetical protein